jgi:hypothetical protein
MLIQLTRTTDAPAKPPEGEPCNGCGYCCDQQPCQIAEEVFGEDVAAPCPALEYEAAERRYYCGLVRRVSHYVAPALDGTAAAAAVNRKAGARFAKMLGTGRGCDSTDPVRPLRSPE